MKLFNRSTMLTLAIVTLMVAAHMAVRRAAAASLPLQVNASKETEGIQQVQNLMAGVGYDFQPNLKLAKLVQQLGIKIVRLINVDGDQQRGRLEQGLVWCRQIGAQPHIIIGNSIPRGLSTHGDNPKSGPKDWEAYQEYLRQIFQYVILEKGFPNATWEVGNEPEIGGAVARTYRQVRKIASEEEYRDYFEMYQHVAEVAIRFEQAHPEVKIILGGPASAGVASYYFGTFNWHERFLRDIAANGIKLDFFSFHYYGNQGSIGNRQNLTPYPPFEKIMANLHTWIGRYKPGLPIWLTEWGPSSIGNMTPAGLINGNFVGAAWSAAFVSTMLQTGVNRAIFLLTADLKDNWGWPALFHQLTPKPPYFVFAMFHKLQGRLVTVQGESPAVGAFAARQGEQLNMVIWNYNWLRQEREGGHEGAQLEQVVVRLSGLAPEVKYQATMSQVSEQYGNPFNPKASPYPLDNNLGKQALQQGVLELNLNLPPSSVTLLEVVPTR
jgi:xylan 1,4-beta-xylosidase